jgi:hypothetical protein
VIPAWSLAHLYPCHAATLAAVRQKIHLTRCAVLPGHLCHADAGCHDEY